MLRIARTLARRGDRVLAVDLPGHGDSPREASGSVESVAKAVVETVRAMTDGQPLIGIGHSYGGTVLAAAAEHLPPHLAVYIDTTCAFRGGADRAELTAQYAADREQRMDANRLRASRPYYSEHDIELEVRTARSFDPATAASLSAGGDVSYAPAPGSILVHAQPSRFITDEEAAEISASGVDVRGIPDAEHTIWYSHFDDFVAALPEVFGDAR